MNRIAVVRVRGRVNASKDVEATLKMLGLNAQNHCVLISDSPVYLGMLQKIKDYATWGKIDKEDVEQLLKERGELAENAVLADTYLKKNTKFSSIEDFAEAFASFKAELDDIPKLKKVFRLHPPRKGHKTIKKPFSMGGALGNREGEIGKLLYRMR